MTLLLLAPCVILLAGTWLLARARRRRRADALRATFDPATIAAWRAREVPDRGGRRPSDRLTQAFAHLQSTDPFKHRAVARSLALARSLSPASAELLLETVAALPERTELAAESALAARCLMETDPGYDARVRLLALEGRLEAEAAETWANDLHRRQA